MDTKEILIASRAKVAQGWTQRAFAVTADGNQTSSGDPAACKWCAVGAINVSATGFAQPLVRCVERVIDNELLMDWNDAPGRTQAEVLAAFDKAIEACQ